MLIMVIGLRGCEGWVDGDEGMRVFRERFFFDLGGGLLFLARRKNYVVFYVVFGFGN